MRADTTAKERLVDDKNKGFADFMAKPETKLMLSMLPQADNPELVQVLLRACFDSGAAVGQGSIMCEVLGHIMKDMTKGQQ